MLTIATWNVNSVRARLERLLAWLEKTAPDVVCLQELKTTDADFPFAALEAAGYHAAVHGQKTYNGVAILSRVPPEGVHHGLDDDVPDAQARLVSARVGDVQVLSAYAPNGAEVGSEQWAYKLDWYRRLRAYLNRRFSPGQSLLLCGDFNVAPEDRDVANPETWRESVLCHEAGRAALQDLLAWGLVDTVRRHHDGQGPYTWWDYRHLAFPKNQGLRIDHILATPSLAQCCTQAFVDREERKGVKPSDHAPVLAVFDV